MLLLQKVHNMLLCAASRLHLVSQKKILLPSGPRGIPVIVGIQSQESYKNSAYLSG